MRRSFEWIRFCHSIDGMSGTLHVETWSENNTDIYFRNGELMEIPNDVQTVPEASDGSADGSQ